MTAPRATRSSFASHRQHRGPTRVHCSARPVERDLFHDRALDLPEQDRFARAPFARFLAEAILTMDAEESFVFALHGNWGSGKSTVLDFRVLSHAFRRALTPLKWIPGIAAPAGAAQDAIEQLHAAADSASQLLETDINEAKGRIRSVLQHGDSRFIVLIDDIDRLRPEEMIQVFQLVKAVADFPRTLYVLSFDRSAVKRALRNSKMDEPDRYLEKIVQAPFDLPDPDPAIVLTVFEEQLRRRRICAADTLDTYFRLAVLPSSVSAADMQKLLAILPDPEATGEYLVQLSEQVDADGRRRIEKVLQMLHAYLEIPHECVPRLIALHVRARRRTDPSPHRARSCNRRARRAAARAIDVVGARLQSASALAIRAEPTLDVAAAALQQAHRRRAAGC
jgi:predicted KAP-like P-loop ATPase